MEDINRLAFQRHGYVFSSGEDDSSDGGKSEFDEEYYNQRPPPEPLQTLQNRVTRIPASGGKNANQPLQDVQRTDSQKENVEPKRQEVLTGNYPIHKIKNKKTTLRANNQPKKKQLDLPKSLPKAWGPIPSTSTAQVPQHGATPRAPGHAPKSTETEAKKQPIFTIPNPTTDRSPWQQPNPTLLTSLPATYATVLRLPTKNKNPPQVQIKKESYKSDSGTSNAQKVSDSNFPPNRGAQPSTSQQNESATGAKTFKHSQEPARNVLNQPEVAVIPRNWSNWPEIHQPHQNQRNIQPHWSTVDVPQPQVITTPIRANVAVDAAEEQKPNFLSRFCTGFIIMCCCCSRIEPYSQIG